MTISEALVKKLPILIIPPIPGQEERNARFLDREGAAVRLPQGSDIEEFILELLDNPVKLGHMRNMAGKLARPDAGADTVKLVERLAYGGEAALKTGKGLILAENY
jgi:processive 1,2-diacylglycerol beta-glucosyltransferase